MTKGRFMFSDASGTGPSSAHNANRAVRACGFVPHAPASSRPANRKTGAARGNSAPRRGERGIVPTNLKTGSTDLPKFGLLPGQSVARLFPGSAGAEVRGSPTLAKFDQDFLVSCFRGGSLAAALMNC